MPVVSIADQASTSWSPVGRRVRVWQLVQIALLLLVVANLGRIPFLDLGDREAPILINDLCVGVVLIAGAISMGQARSVRLNDVALAALTFAAIGGLSALSAMPRFGLTPFETVASLAYLARWVFYFALYVVVINTVRAERAEALWSALETAMLVFAIFGVFQSIFLPDFALMIYPQRGDIAQWDVQRHRLVSTVLDPNVAAGMLAIVLLMQIARLATGAPMSLWKALVLFVAMVLTLSRSGALALLIGGLVVIAARGMSKRVAKFVGAAILLAAISLPRLISFASEYQRFGFSDASAMARVAVWRHAITLLIQHPWFGIGFNTFGYVQERLGVPRASASTYSVEGGLLFVAVMTGIVGLAVYVAMIGFVIRRCRRGWRNPLAGAHERALFIGTTAATVAILVHSAFVNSLLIPFVMEPLWVLWGLSFLLERELHARAAPARRSADGFTTLASP